MLSIVAISGLGGHAFGSFKERGGEHMWLRDALPHDLILDDGKRPVARVMIYGDDSGVSQSSNMQNLEDLASSFITSILALAGVNVKPILIIAHSLGGLIVKQVRSTSPLPTSCHTLAYHLGPYIALKVQDQRGSISSSGGIWDHVLRGTT